MFSVRIVTVDHYQSTPAKDFDICYSDFRGCEIYKVPVIRVFGLTPAGQKVCLHIHGVFPYMYILCDETMPKYESDHQFRKFAQELAFSIDKALNVASRSSGSFKHHVYKIVSTSGIPFYGYHERPQSFLKIFFYNPYDIKKTAELLASGAIMNKIIQPYESHIPYILQFFIDTNLFGMNFLNVSTLKFRVATDDYFSSEASSTLPSSSGNSPADINSSNKVWTVDEINRPPMCSKIKKQTCCELEADCIMNNILNRLDTQSAHGNNPGILAIWEEERQRRREKLESSQISPASSQERPDVIDSESEMFYKERLKKLLHKMKESRAAGELADLTGVYESPSSSQRSFNPSSSLSDTQDKELLSMVLSMVGSQASPAEQDSILSQVIKNDEEEEEEDDDVVTLEMSQCVDDDWILNDSLGMTHDRTIVDDQLGDQASSQRDNDGSHHRSFTIPQLDGAGDDEDDEEKKSYGFRNSFLHSTASGSSSSQNLSASSLPARSAKRTLLSLKKKKKGPLHIKRESLETRKEKDQMEAISPTRSSNEIPVVGKCQDAWSSDGFSATTESNLQTNSSLAENNFHIQDHELVRLQRTNSDYSTMTQSLRCLRIKRPQNSIPVEPRIETPPERFTRQDLYSIVRPTSVDLEKIGKERVILEKLSEEFLLKYRVYDIPKPSISSSKDKVSEASFISSNTKQILRSSSISSSSSTLHNNTDAFTGSSSNRRHSSPSALISPSSNDKHTKPIIVDTCSSSCKQIIESLPTSPPSQDDQTTPLSPSLKMKFKIKRINTRSKESHFIVVDKKLDESSENTAKVAPLKIRYSPIANVSQDSSRNSQEFGSSPSKSCDGNVDYLLKPRHKRMRPMGSKLNMDLQNKSQSFKSPLLDDTPWVKLEDDREPRKRKHYPFHKRKHSSKANTLANEKELMVEQQLDNPDENSQPVDESHENLQPLVVAHENLQPVVDNHEKPLVKSLILKVPVKNKEKGLNTEMSLYTSAIENDFKMKKHNSKSSKKLKLKLQRREQKLPKLQLKLSCNLWTCDQNTDERNFGNSEFRELESSHSEVNEKSVKIVLPKCSPKKRTKLNLNTAFLDEDDDDNINHQYIDNDTIDKSKKNCGPNKHQNLWKPCVVKLTRLTHKILSEYNVPCLDKCHLCEHEALKFSSQSELPTNSESDQIAGYSKSEQESESYQQMQNDECVRKGDMKQKNAFRRTKHHFRKESKGKVQIPSYKPVFPTMSNRQRENQLCDATDQIVDKFLKNPEGSYSVSPCEQQVNNVAQDFQEKSSSEIHAPVTLTTSQSIDPHLRTENAVQAPNRKARHKKISNVRNQIKQHRLSTVSCDFYEQSEKKKIQIPHFDQIDQIKDNLSEDRNKADLVLSDNPAKSSFQEKLSDDEKIVATSIAKQENGKAFHEQKECKAESCTISSDNQSTVAFNKQIKEEKNLKDSIHEQALKGDTSLAVQSEDEVLQSVKLSDMINKSVEPQVDEEHTPVVSLVKQENENSLQMESSDEHQAFISSIHKQIDELKVLSCPITSDSPLCTDETSITSSPLPAWDESSFAKDIIVPIAQPLKSEGVDDHIDVMWRLSYLSPKEEVLHPVVSPPRSWSPNSDSIDFLDSWELASNKPGTSVSPISTDDEFMPSKKSVPAKKMKLPNFLFEDFTFSSDSFSPECKQMPQATSLSQASKECFTESCLLPEVKFKTSEKLLFSPELESLGSQPSPKPSRSSILYHTLTAGKQGDIAGDNESSSHTPCLKGSPQVSTNLIAEESKNLYFSTPPSTELSFYSTLEDDMDSMCNSPFELGGLTENNKSNDAGPKLSATPNSHENDGKSVQDTNYLSTVSATLKSSVKGNQFQVFDSPDSFGTKSTIIAEVSNGEDATETPSNFTDWFSQHPVHSQLSHDSPSSLLPSNEPLIPNNNEVSSSSQQSSHRSSLLIAQLKAEPQRPTKFSFAASPNLPSCARQPNRSPSLSRQNTMILQQKPQGKSTSILLPKSPQINQSKNFSLPNFQSSEGCMENEVLPVTGLHTKVQNFGSPVVAPISNENSHSNDLLSKLVKSCDIDKEFDTDFFFPETVDQEMSNNAIVIQNKYKNFIQDPSETVDSNYSNKPKTSKPETTPTSKPEMHKSSFCIENLLKSPVKKPVNNDTIIKTMEVINNSTSKLPQSWTGSSDPKSGNEAVLAALNKPFSPKPSTATCLSSSSYSNFSGIQSFYGDETLYSLPAELDSIGSPQHAADTTFGSSQSTQGFSQNLQCPHQTSQPMTSVYSTIQPSSESLMQVPDPKPENKDFFLGEAIPPFRDKTFRPASVTSSHVDSVPEVSKKKSETIRKSRNFFKPKVDPPSKREVEAAANGCNFPQEQHQRAFYGDPSDIEQKNNENPVSKVKSKATYDLPEFDGAFRNTKEDYCFSRGKSSSSQPSDSFCLADEIEKNPDYKLLFCNDKPMIQMPNISPPSRLSVCEWLENRNAIQAGAAHQKYSNEKTCDESTKKVEIPEELLQLPQSPISVLKDYKKLPFSKTPSMHSKPLFSTPLSGKMHKPLKHQELLNETPSSSRKKSQHEFESDVASFSPTTSLNSSLKKRKLIFESEKRKTQDFRIQKMKEVFCSTLSPNNSLLSNLLNKSSSQLDGPSYENSGNFKLNLGSSNDACNQNQHENQHLTLLCMEIHVNTRGNLRPDPEQDPIAALFFCISIESDENPQYLNGVIVIEDRQNCSSSQIASFKKELLSTSNLTRDLVFYVESEAKGFEAFINVVQQFDPEFLVGYEIQALSFGYLIQRASRLGFDLKRKISRLVVDNYSGEPVNPGKDMDQEDAEIDPQFDLQITGRIILNVWRLMRKEIALTSYTFENMYYHVLHKRIPLYSFETLTTWYTNTKLMQWKVVRHYLNRVEGSIRLMEKLNIIGRTSELARIFGIQFYEVLSRGSQFRVESMMLRTAKPLNYIPVSPTIQQRSRSRAPECVPLIFEPESRFYTDPVLILDFQSLYPSMIIAYNYCFSTCLGRIEHFGKTGPFDFGCTSLSISLDLLRKLEKQIHISPTGVAFIKANVKRGVLPIMLEEILNTRIMVKQSMKLCKSNKALSRILDSRQLGLKLIANVTYGYTSANFSGRMPCVEIADSIVGKGRETLERAIRVIEESMDWKAKVVYGDTDSVFVLLPGRSKEQAFKIGQDIADVVTSLNPKPVKLKFEKVYFPCVLQTKKRYVGYMYETLDQKEPVFDAKGIETVRRDSCPAVGKILEKSIKILFDSRDVSLVKKYVLKQFEKFASGRVSLADCIFAKEYRGRSGYRPAACVPGLEIAKKRALTDPKAEPLPGERVPYVIVYGFPGLPIIQLVKEPLEFLNDWSLRINAKYYITRVITPPLERIFSLIGISVKNWYINISYAQLPSLPMAPVTNKPRGTLSQYFKSLCCPACDKMTNFGVCDACRSESQTTTVILNDKIRTWERTYHHLAQICSGCSASQCFEDCISLDCPVFFRLNQSRRDLAQIPYLRNILLNELF